MAPESDVPTGDAIYALACLLSGACGAAEASLPLAIAAHLTCLVALAGEAPAEAQELVAGQLRMAADMAHAQAAVARGEVLH
jgi:hypothetical protein